MTNAREMNCEVARNHCWRQIMLEQLRRKKVRSIWPMKEVTEMIGGSNFMQNLVADLKKRRVKVQVIRFPHQEMEYEGWQNTPQESWREIRYAKEGTYFPLAIQIYDEDTVAFIASKKEGFGIMIESPELAHAMIYLFELFWGEAS